MIDKALKFTIELKIQLLYFFNGLVFSTILSPFAWVFSKVLGYANKIILRDQDFIAFIFVIVFIDGAVGIWKWMKLSKFNEKKLLIGFVEKLLICLMAMIVFNIFILAAGDKHSDISSYLNLFAAITILSYPALSIFKNMFFISNGKFPPIGFMRKMENFENTADINTIFSQEKSKQDETN